MYVIYSGTDARSLLSISWRMNNMAKYGKSGDNGYIGARMIEFGSVDGRDNDEADVTWNICGTGHFF